MQREKTIKSVDSLLKALPSSPSIASLLDALCEAITEWSDCVDSQLLSAAYVPICSPSIEAIELCRASRCQRVANASSKFADAEAQPQFVNFAAAYHGMDNGPLNAQVGALQTIQAVLKIPAGAATHQSSTPLRLGIFSMGFHSHTMFKLFGGLVAAADKGAFDLYVIAPPLTEKSGFRDMEVYWHFKNQMGVTFLEAPGKSPEVAKRIQQLDLEFLLFTDIGMDDVTQFYATKRLAKLQAVTWGHPDTSGLTTIDYFFTSKDFETPESLKSYTETPIVLQNPLFVFERPNPPAVFYDRDFFKLPPNRNLYVCLQTPFKLHPDFDEALAGIVAADEDALFVFIENQTPLLNYCLNRLVRKFPALAGRIHRVPKMDMPAFLSLAALADVVLDTFPFSGGNSSLEVFGVGTPIVTMKTGYLRGRLTAAFYKMMGIQGLTATDISSYVSVAIKVATDKEYQARLRQDILQNNYKLYANVAGANELYSTVEKLVHGRPIELNFSLPDESYYTPGLAAEKSHALVGGELDDGAVERLRTLLYSKIDEGGRMASINNFEIEQVLYR